MFKALLKNSDSRFTLMKLMQVDIVRTNSDSYKVYQKVATRRDFKRAEKVISEYQHEGHEKLKNGYYIAQLFSGHISFSLESYVGNNYRKVLSEFIDSRMNNELSFIKKEIKDRLAQEVTDSEKQYGNTLYEEFEDIKKSEDYEDSLLDIFEEAKIGIKATTGSDVYDYDLCLDILYDKDYTEEEVDEYMSRVMGIYIGGVTPIFIIRKENN